MTPDEAQAAAPHVLGIDVSAANGTFDWLPWHGKIGFALMRATSWDSASGFGRDPQLGRNAAESWRHWDGRLVRGYYHETRTAVTGPVTQARAFVSCLGPDLVAGDLLAVAMGDNGGNGAMTSLEISMWHASFFGEMYHQIGDGHRGLAYCNPSWAERGNVEGMGHRPLWLADYGVGTRPAAPRPWQRWTFLQYQGVPGPDRNIFDGDQRQLADFAAMPPYRR